MRIEILMFEGVDELDVMAPWEVFNCARAHRPDLSVALVAWPAPSLIEADHGARFEVGEALSDDPAVVWVPGGGWFDRQPRGVWHLVGEGVLPARLAALHSAGTTIASVCTGALLLAEAGLLDGRRATTNPEALADLLDRGVDAVPARVVDAGSVLTAGAPSCGFDLALLLVERLVGQDVSRAIEAELALRSDRDHWIVEQAT